LAKSGGSGLCHDPNPANGDTLASVTQGTAKDIDAAVKAARRAQPKWARLPGHKRAKYLYALARLIQKHSPPAGRAGNHGQRQTDPRKPRHRHPPGRAPFLLPRRAWRS
jgi:acyl-CoA reductase-like NAD-dependent aldehyde dehydrogenase